MRNGAPLALAATESIVSTSTMGCGLAQVRVVLAEQVDRMLQGHDVQVVIVRAIPANVPEGEMG